MKCRISRIISVIKTFNPIMKLKFFFISCAFTFNSFASAQTTLQVTEPAFYVLDTSDVVPLRLSVKINELSNAKSVLFLLGTASDSSDVLLVSASVALQNGSYFLLYNNSKDPVLGHSASVVVSLSKEQFNLIKYLTIYAKDLAGLETQRVVVQVK